MGFAHDLDVRSVAYYAMDFRRTNASGLTTYVRSMRDALSSRGVRVRVMTRSADPGDASAEVFQPLPWVRRSTWLANKVSLGLIPSLEEDLMIARYAMRLERRDGVQLFEIEEHAGLGSLLVRAPLSSPVVVRTHGPHFLVTEASQVPWDDTAKRVDRREREAVRLASALTVPSRDTLHRIREHWQLELPHARVIPNATPLVPEDATWRGKHEGPVLFVGRIDRLKGVDLVVRAFAELAREFPERELWIVGPEYPLRDGARCYARFSEFVEAVVPDASVRARIRHLGPKPPEELLSLRRDAGVVLVASRFETFCLAAVEAMMVGCPLIVPNANALPELVTDNRTGLTFQSGDARDLARALRQVLGSKELASRLGQAARETAKQRFSPDVVVKDTLGFYTELVQAQGRPPRLYRALRGAAP